MSQTPPEWSLRLVADSTRSLGENLSTRQSPERKLIIPAPSMTA
jgi:hypothetical protein